MSERWVTISEAAKALGVSQATVRRRIARSMLDVQVEADGKKLVRVPGRIDGEGSAGVGERATSVGASDKSGERTAGGARASTVEARMERLFDPDRPKRFAPGDLIPDSDGEESETHRYQRLAGAAVVLAQRQTDEANEKLELLVDQHRKLRQLFFVSSGALVGVLLVTVMLLWSSSREAGRAGQAEVTLRQGIMAAEARADDAERALGEAELQWLRAGRVLSEVPER